MCIRDSLNVMVVLMLLDPISYITCLFDNLCDDLEKNGMPGLRCKDILTHGGPIRVAEVTLLATKIRFVGFSCRSSDFKIRFS